MNKRQIGNRGEQIASEFLTSNGYIIKRTNLYTPYGEIDIIAIKERTLYFIEVKFRRSNSYGSAREAVNYSKKKNMKASVIYYFKTMNAEYLPFKISYLGVISSNSKIEFDFIENIFD